MNASIELAKYYYSIKDFQKANETILNCIGHPRIRSREKPNNELLVLNYYWLFKAHLEQQKNTEALHYFKAYDSLKTVRDEAREARRRSEEHTSELQSRPHLVCRLLLEKKKKRKEI